MKGGVGLVELGLDEILFLDQLDHALLRHLGELERGLGIIEIALGLNHRRLKNRGIEFPRLPGLL